MLVGRWSRPQSGFAASEARILPRGAKFDAPRPILRSFRDARGAPGPCQMPRLSFKLLLRESLHHTFSGSVLLLVHERLRVLAGCGGNRV